MGNSTRNILQATYTPFEASNESDEGKRGREKCAVVRYLSPTNEELSALKTKYETENSQVALNAIRLLLETNCESGQPSCINALARMGSATLICIGQDLINLRNKSIGQIEEFIKELSQQRPHFDNFSSTQSILDWPKQNSFKKDVALRIKTQSNSLGLDLSRLTPQDLIGLRERQVKQVEEFTTNLDSAKIPLDVNTIVAQTILDQAIKRNFKKEVASRIFTLSKALKFNLSQLTLPDLIDLLKEQGNEIRDFIQAIYCTRFSRKARLFQEKGLA